MQPRATTPLDSNLPQSSQPPGDAPPPDCPAHVEQLAEYTDDLDMQAQFAVFLVGQVPRTENSAAEHALRRIGRAVERLATTATTAALYAQSAVVAVRKQDDKPDEKR